MVGCMILTAKISQLKFLCVALKKTHFPSPIIYIKHVWD